jgi:hypothetical protein
VGGWWVRSGGCALAHKKAHLYIVAHKALPRLIEAHRERCTLGRGCFPPWRIDDQVHHDPDAKQAAHVVELQQQLASAQAVILPKPLPPFCRPAHSPAHSPRPRSPLPNPPSPSASPSLSHFSSIASSSLARSAPFCCSCLEPLTSGLHVRRCDSLAGDRTMAGRAEHVDQGG